MFIKRTIPGGVNKKIVINNGNIITYKMLYIPVGMLLTVYLETLNCPRNPVFNCNSTNFCSPLFFIKVIIFSACGKDY